MLRISHGLWILLPMVVASCQPSGALYDDMRQMRDSADVRGKMSMQMMAQEVRMVSDMVPKGRHGRRVFRRMDPRYITVHSTQNYSPQADALKHALALKRGALKARQRKNGNRIGYLIWHFSVDDRMAVQHMPLHEQGEHADFDGPGNRYSIGIEMCENRGGHLSTTVDRTAKLCAILMKQYRIPLRNVVPHYHWERRGVKPPHKDCPNFLMDGGRPGARWRLFQQLVDAHYRRLL